jgi:hypothetical protein
VVAPVLATATVFDAMIRCQAPRDAIDAKPPSGPEGDRDGSGIRNGVARVVKAGDTIFIPAGVPHQITAVKGGVQFLLFRFDTR